MDKFDSFEAILDFAIERESQAHEFYMELAGQVERAALRKTLEGFAKEELGHKAKLEAVKKGQNFPSAGRVADLKMSDYLTDVEPSSDMNYRDILVAAMKKEKAAFKFYSDLAAIAEDENLVNTFLSLAQEEAKHKLRFEIEYDEEVLKDN